MPMLSDRRQALEPRAIIARALEITRGFAAFVTRAARGRKKLNFAWE